MVAALYKVEQVIRNDVLNGPEKRARRQELAKPILDRFFAWTNEQFDKAGFSAKQPFPRCAGLYPRASHRTVRLPRRSGRSD